MRTIQHLAVAAVAGGLAATYLFHVGVESGSIRLAGALAFAASPVDGLIDSLGDGGGFHGCDGGGGGDGGGD